MLEDMARDVFLNGVRKVIKENEPLVRLRGAQRQVNEFKDYLSFGEGYTSWDGWLIKKVTNAKKDNPIRDAFVYFTHGEKMRDAWIRKNYGTMENAMRTAGTFTVLFDTFINDFRNRRERFLADMQGLIDTAKQQALAQKRSVKMPQSHGGVANLLKVLTATMKQQGSSIKTIAKVQYAVCLQAGILIPEEFITDVMVAANIENER